MQIGQFVRGMLKGFIVQASQLASCLLWEEEQKASGVMWEVQSLSRDLWYHPETAPAVEARLHKLTSFEQGPSKVLLRDTLAWMIVAEFEMVDISQLANAGKQSTLDAVARQVAPCLCDNNDRRSLLLNAVHKNIKQMLRLGQHLTSSFDVPSANRTGAAKKKRKGGGKQRRDGQAELPDDAIVIDMDPGLAFGTGTHQTTDLCLQHLDNHPPKDLSVIDYGSGTGILAIAAAKLGAISVVAVDNDPQAVLATKDNVANNQCDDIIAIHHTDDNTALEKCDLLVANILANPLVELELTFSDLVKEGGGIVLSGILDEQLEVILEAYKGHFDYLKVQQKDEWCRVSGTRNNKKNNN